MIFLDKELPNWAIEKYGEQRLSHEILAIRGSDLVPKIKSLLDKNKRVDDVGSAILYALGLQDEPKELAELDYDNSLPDIDIDFQDDRRELAFTYLKKKYGAERVARLGTVMRYKAKSAIDDVARELSIPKWEVNELKDSIIERSGGDSRSRFCILDTFNELEVGRKTLEKFPQLKLAAEIEYHARQSGQHAAGMIVTAEPVSHYCSINQENGSAMIDKHDAEDLNLLKIDALGLRTLSVIQDCLDQVGWSREQLLAHSIEDERAFEILRQSRFAGIFQFAGYALQNICRQMMIKEFKDIAAITALARPGPLTSGSTTEYIKRHNGESKVKFIHPLMEKYTGDTYGIVIYQENVMNIVRNVGKLSWEDTSTLRKAMSKSLGKEYFDTFKVRFVAGAKENGLLEKEAEEIWNNVNTHGSWSFNKSHAVAYGLVSYWCCLLKALFPLEFAAACLRNEGDEEKVVGLLRELDREGFKFKAVDAEKSQENWTVDKATNTLIGGLLNIRGIGMKSAQDIIKRRDKGLPMSDRQIKMLTNPETPYDQIFECRERFGDYYANPKKYNIESELSYISEINSDKDGQYCFIGKLKTKNLRDLNEAINVQKRGGRILENDTLSINFIAEDDTANIRCSVSRYKFEKWGRPLIDECKIGDWFIFKGKIMKGWPMVNIEKWRKL